MDQIPCPSAARNPADTFQRLAASGENTFLTGPAGTGKSYEVDRFTEANRDTCVTASTGVAALNVGGMTVHRWCGMLLGPKRGEDFDRYFRQLSHAPRPSTRAAFNRVRRCKRLVIDEISMLSGRHFDYLDFHCSQIRGDDRPFGGIQVIGTGDFLQLPPVRTNPRQPYDWAFDTAAWEAAGFRTVELTRIMRQDDPEFASALSRFRRGDIDRDVRRLLEPRVVLFPSQQLTRLLTHNAQVDRWNDYCLAELPGPESVREAETYGPQHQIDFLKKNLLTPATLRLKPGARVMFTVNRPDDGFVNGQTGVVVSVGTSSVIVESHGKEIEAAPYRWNFDSNDPGTAWFEQFPLRLAYAMTIHKAQGLTLDEAFIDIRAAREPGQAYVALSRVRTLDGLHLKDWPKGIFVSQRALDFHSTPPASRR